jgi:hypothetical protein
MGGRTLLSFLPMFDSSTNIVFFDRERLDLPAARVASSYCLKPSSLPRFTEVRILEFGVHDHLLEYYFFRLLDTIYGGLIHVGNH